VTGIPNALYFMLNCRRIICPSTFFFLFVPFSEIMGRMTSTLMISEARLRAELCQMMGVWQCQEHAVSAYALDDFGNKGVAVLQARVVDLCLDHSSFCLVRRDGCKGHVLVGKHALGLLLPYFAWKLGE
jgi:hypothetical protein